MSAVLRGLRFRVGLAVFVGVGALALFVISESDRQFSRASADAGKQQLLAIARSFSNDLSQSDPSLLRSQAMALQSLNPNIDDLSVYRERRGRFVRVATTSPMGRTAPIDRRTRSASETGRFNYFVKEDHRLAQLAYPLRARPGQRPEVVEISYYLGPLDAAFAKSKQRLTWAAAGAALLLALLVIGLLGRGVFAPLNKLRLATRSIRRGELGTRLRWRRRDELGALSRGFDEMAETLEEHERLKALALEDPLTGLLNHRAFQERLFAELSRARREGYPVSLAAIDIDYFKNVNDSAGHAVGDEALRMVAHSMVQVLRPSDICGRVGGDEFMVALHGLDASEAKRVVERLRAAISSAQIDPSGHPVTASAGIAEFPRHAGQQPDLMRFADGAMYWSKSAGRNLCSIYSPDAHEALSAEEEAESIRRSSLVRTVHALARAVDAKDGYTHLHSQRVAYYAGSLASSLGLDYQRTEAIRTAGILHDVGKIGIPDAILLKPSGFTADELTVMQHHSELGRDIIAGAGMTEVAHWVHHLHDRPDGRGYPGGIVGDEIPLESMVLHAADALEAMTSPRIYRPALPLEDALAELQDNAGTQFDPEIAERLVELVRSGKLLLGALAPVMGEVRSLRPVMPADARSSPTRAAG